MNGVAVIGLGKIGLPLAVQFASARRQVIGVDINSRTVDLVNQGVSPVPGEANLDALLSEVVAGGRLSATTNLAEAVSAASEVVIVVPLLIDAENSPDFSVIDDVTSNVGRSLRKGALVSYETTLPVGTTRIRFTESLSRESGLTVGKDFHVVFSPERVLTGRVFADLRRYPKLVGGVTASCAERGENFYAEVLEFDERTDLKRPNGVWNLGSCEAAELAKLAETTYRDVNIALANQFAKFASRTGLDINTVIEACNSQPHSQIHRPGIAVGGHCIPVYPHLYLSNDPSATLVRTARQVNLEMPEHYVSKLEDAHGSLAGENVLVLGASYRGDVKETTLSGVFAVVKSLRSRGAICWVDDPYFAPIELEELGLPARGPITDVSAVVIQADHSSYRSFDFSMLPKLRTILKGRNIPLTGVHESVRQVSG